MNKRATAFAGMLACLLTLPMAAFAQLPSPSKGWNLGNSLEPPCGVGCWGTAPTQALINSAAAQGFNTLRIPCAWNSNSSNGTINSTYMNTVKQCVDWAVAKGMYVIINDHWDNGWFEGPNTKFDSYSSSINSTLQNLWTQVANTFKNYDSHVLFACANEPNADTQARTNVLFQYYRNWVPTIRNTGGNNSTRWLLVEGPNTNIDLTCSYVTSSIWPSDSRVMIEVHEYVPWNFVGMTQDESWGIMWYFWGAQFHVTGSLANRNCQSAEEAYMDDQMNKMKTTFANNGKPVLIGEYGAGPKPAESDLTGNYITQNKNSTRYWTYYVRNSAVNHGLYQTYWSIQNSIFDWSNGNVTDQTLLNAVMGTSYPGPVISGGGTTYSSNITNGNHAVVPQNATGARLDANGNSATNGTKVQIWNGGTQTWAFTNTGSGIYQIAEAAHTSACLDVIGGGGSGTNVDIWACNSGSNQKWGAVSISGNIYSFAPQCATGARLDVVGNGTANGTQVDIWTSNGANNQKWAVN